MEGGDKKEENLHASTAQGDVRIRRTLRGKLYGTTGMGENLGTSTLNLKHKTSRLQTVFVFVPI